MTGCKVTHYSPNDDKQHLHHFCQSSDCRLYPIHHNFHCRFLFFLHILWHPQKFLLQVVYLELSLDDHILLKHLQSECSCVVPIHQSCNPISCLQSPNTVHRPSIFDQFLVQSERIEEPLEHDQIQVEHRQHQHQPIPRNHHKLYPTLH